jgi:cellulose synthase/poly-beta-1,6-N-acetylglucosamine synthase-like glycosyltransferase
MGKVSIIVPCRNEVKNIEETVLSILDSDYPSVEVLICDGRSDDGTRDVIAKLTEKYSNVKMVDNPEQFTPFAFNHGIRAASGEYILIGGARNTLAKDYLSLLVDCFKKDPEVQCSGGEYVHKFDGNASRFISYAMACKFGVGGSNFRTQKEDAFVDTVGIPLYKKSIFDEIGLFNEQLTRNQDDELNFRLTKKGHKIRYCYDAKTYYLVRPSFQKLFKQYGQYGYYKVLVGKMHRGVSTLRQLVPMLFVLFLITGFTSLLWKPYTYFYCAILAIYFLAGHLLAREFTSKFTEVLMVQWAMLVMHLGYGIGYLQGIWRFVIRGQSASNDMQKQTT